MDILKIKKAAERRSEFRPDTLQFLLDRHFTDRDNDKLAAGLAIAYNQTILKGYDPSMMERMYQLIEHLLQWAKDHHGINFIDIDIMQEANILRKMAKIELRTGMKEALVFKSSEAMWDFIETAEKTDFKDYKANNATNTLSFDFMSYEHRIYANTNFDVEFTTVKTD